MKPRPLIAIALLLCLRSFSQISTGASFTSTVPATYKAVGLASDPFGNFYFLNEYSPNSTPGTIVLSKSDAQGSILWRKTITDVSWQMFPNNIKVNANSIYICGRAQSTPGQRAFVVRLDLNGGLIWQRNVDSLQSANFNSLCIDVNGGCFVSGSCFPSNTGNYAGLICRIDSSGNVLWCQRVETITNPHFGLGGLICDGSNNIYCSGAFSWSASNFKTCLLKFDSAGNLLWCKSYSDSSAVFAFSPSFIYNNCLYFSGYYKAWNGFMSTACIGKSDLSGNLLDLRFIGDSANTSTANSCSLTPLNTMVVTGYNGTIVNHSGYVMEIDMNLNAIRGLKNDSIHELQDFEMTNNGNCALTGWSQTTLYCSHRNYSDYSWSWGCGFYSMTDSLTTFSAVDSIWNLNTAPIAITSGSSTINNISIPETTCDNLAGIHDPAIHAPNIYPNPVSNLCTVTFPTPFTKPTIFDITDITGKLVQLAVMDVGMQTLEINTADLPDGIYFLKSEDGFIAKITVTH